MLNDNGLKCGNEDVKLDEQHDEQSNNQSSEHRLNFLIQVK